MIYWLCRSNCCGKTRPSAKSAAAVTATFWLTNFKTLQPFNTKLSKPSPKSTGTSRLSATTISRFIRGEALISATSSALSGISPNGEKLNWNRTTVQPKTFWKPPTGSFPAISIEKQKTSGREENPAGTSNFSRRRTKKPKPPSSRQPSVPFALTTNSNTATSPCWSEPIRSALQSKQNC